MIFNSDFLKVALILSFIIIFQIFSQNSAQPGQNTKKILHLQFFLSLVEVYICKHLNEPNSMEKTSGNILFLKLNWNTSDMTIIKYSI